MLPNNTASVCVIAYSLAVYSMDHSYDNDDMYTTCYTYSEFLFCLRWLNSINLYYSNCQTAVTI